MKSTTFTKKLKLYPMGDKTEIDRVYQYIRDGQYTQYLALNRIMSRVGTLYYNCERDFNSEEFKEGYKEILKSNNPLLDDLVFPKGADIKSAVFQKVRNDFSTSLKNGLAKGERVIPTYKRTGPLLMKGRSISVRTQTSEEGKEIFVLSWVNKIELKVVMGSSGRNNESLMELLCNLAEKNENYKICGSQIYVDGKCIFINLVVKKTVEDTIYEPVAGKVMGVALGYEKPISCTFNDDSPVYSISTEVNYIQERQRLQEKYRRKQQQLKYTKGGHGRKSKLEELRKYKHRETEFVKYFNHLLSKQIVELAVANQAEMIVVENITKADLNSLPIFLRNWSYYPLNEFVTYKAKLYGIKTITSKSKEIGNTCCKCGVVFEKENTLPKEIVWTQEVSFTCPDCGERVEYSFNKAKNLAHMG